MVFLIMKPAMGALLNINADGIPILHHNPIGAEIHPPLVRIAGYYEVSSTYIAATIFLVPLWRRKFEKVHVFSGLDIFQDWPIVNEFGGKLIQLAFPPPKFMRNKVHKLCSRRYIGEIQG